MKRARKIPLVSLIGGLLAPAVSSAQPFIDQLGAAQTTDHQRVKQTFDQYFSGRWTGRGSGYKQFQRVLQFHAERAQADGTLPNAAAHIRDAVRALETIPRVARTTAWSFLGPTDTVPGQVGLANALSLTPGMGRLNVVEFDPSDGNVIYVGSASGGLWRSNDAGSSWRPLTDRAGLMAISDIAIDPRDSRQIFLLTGDGEGFILPSVGVFVSRDGGDTWTGTGLLFPPDKLVWGFRLLINPVDPDTLLAATSQCIYRSTDAGATWKVVADGNFRDLEFHPADPSIVYASTTTQILRSADGGASWNLVSGSRFGDNHPVPTTRIALAVSPASPDVVYAVAGNENGFAGLWRSDDAGKTFPQPPRSSTPNLLGASPQGTDNLSHAWYDLALAVDPDNVDRVFVGGINIWSSMDGGQTWTLSGQWQEALKAQYAYVHPDIHRLVIKGGQVYAATDGGLWTIGGAYAGWTPLSRGLSITEIFSVCAGPGANGTVMYGAQDNGTNLLIGPIAVQLWGGDGTICQVDPSTNYLYMASQFGDIFFSADGGANFTRAWPNSPAPAPSGSYVTPYQLHPQLPQYVYACYQDVYLGLRGTFGVNTFIWQQLTAGALGTGLGTAMRVAPSNASIVYVAKAATLLQPAALFRSDGLVWQQITGPWPSNSVSISGVAVTASDANRVAVSLSGYVDGAKVFYSADGGGIWSNLSANLPNVPTGAILFEDGAKNGIYVGTDVGVFYRNDSMSAWALMGDNLPRVIVRSLVVQPGTNRLIAGTFGRGVFKARLIDPPAGVATVE